MFQSCWFLWGDEDVEGVKSILSAFKITKIQTLPMYWTFDVERNSDETIIIRETKTKLIRKII